MKPIITSIATFLISLLLVSKSYALLDLRATYGLLTTNTNLSSICSSCGSVPAIVPTYGMGADAILTLPVPLLPGIGLRYENMGMSASTGGIEIKSEYTRSALILNWRPLNNLVYLGPIFTYGLSHSTKISATGSPATSFESNSVSSYSAGLELGLNILGFSLGAEAGYLSMNWKNAKDSSGTLPDQNINMSGPYSKVVLGLYF